MFLPYALKTFDSRYSKWFDFSQNIDCLFEILSKTVVKKLGIMFMVFAFPNIYTACHTDEKRYK